MFLLQVKAMVRVEKRIQPDPEAVRQYDEIYQHTYSRCALPRNPKPEARSPRPETRNSKTEARNPRPEIRDTKSGIRNRIPTHEPEPEDIA